MVDAYGTDDGFLAYHTARGRAVGTIDPDDIAPARLVASEWLDRRYRASFGGYKIGLRAQVREWPRTGAQDRDGYPIASDSVPVEVEAATYEAAHEVMRNPTALGVAYTPPKYKRASVEGAVSVEYNSFASAFDMQTEFPAIGQAISAILTGGGGNASALSGSVLRV